MGGAFKNQTTRGIDPLLIQQVPSVSSLKLVLYVDITYTSEFGPHSLVKIFCLQQERYNSHDRFAMTIMKDGSVVGRIPQEPSYAYWTFQEKGGALNVKLLEKGNLERDWRCPVYTRFIDLTA